MSQYERTSTVSNFLQILFHCFVSFLCNQELLTDPSTKHTDADGFPTLPDMLQKRMYMASYLKFNMAAKHMKMALLGSVCK